MIASLLMATVVGGVAPAGLKGVSHAEKAATLSTPARTALVENGFAVVAGREQHFFALYDRNAYQGLPSFVSVDVVLHVFHVRFEEELAREEILKAVPALRAFSESQMKSALSAGKLEVARYHAMALQLLDESNDVDARLAIDADVRKLREATDSDAHVAACPERIDATLFKPRSHYDRPALRGYFRAFTFYSQCRFELSDRSLSRAQDIVRRLTPESDALIKPMMEVFERINGTSSGPTRSEVLAMQGGRSPPHWSLLAPNLGADSALFLEAASADGFRMPSVLDLLTAMGSSEARTLLAASPARSKTLGALPKSKGLYGEWLEVLRTVITPPTKQPRFASTPAWRKRALVSAAGSWAELKHDTLLYMEQPLLMKEGGHDAELPAVKVGGYVEPRPDVYRALLALWESLVARSEEESLGEFLRFLINVSELEVAQAAMRPEIDERLRSIGGELEHLSRTGSDRSPREAVIADIFTLRDPERGTQDVLHVATGDIDELWVVVPRAGRLVLMRGGAYSYYELTPPNGIRLNDEQWWQSLEGSPPRPKWATPFVKKPSSKN